MPAPPEPFTDLVAPVAGGRVFAQEVVPRLGDAAPGGRVRLDALAEWLQDVAYADVLDAGLHEAALWVVRRARLSVRRFPRFGEPATVRTWCSGLGRLWAERRTSVTTAAGGDVEAVALWVHLDPRGGRPVPLDERELAVYGASAAGREVRARLRHGPPGAEAASERWRFRATDLDLADHVNNAVAWRPLEEELLAAPGEIAQIDAEIEHRAPIQPGELEVRRAPGALWLVADGGDVRASILHRPSAGR
ncbi:MAG TPA: acyl-ACP thioesterase domain-containing protein [Solirubrobacteraceae bacterium]|nr:acyl-ACP thioesterase domain-containing protein [Solirubrobacteraceae bacterium]